MEEPAKKMGRTRKRLKNESFVERAANDAMNFYNSILTFRNGISYLLLQYRS